MGRGLDALKNNDSEGDRRRRGGGGGRCRRDARSAQKGGWWSRDVQRAQGGSVGKGGGGMQRHEDMNGEGTGPAQAQGRGPLVGVVRIVVSAMKEWQGSSKITFGMGGLGWGVKAWARGGRGTHGVTSAAPPPCAGAGGNNGSGGTENARRPAARCRQRVGWHAQGPRGGGAEDTPQRDTGRGHQWGGGVGG